MTTREQALEAALREARDGLRAFAEGATTFTVARIDAALALPPDGRVERLCERMAALLRDIVDDGQTATVLEMRATDILAEIEAAPPAAKETTDAK